VRVSEGNSFRPLLLKFNAKILAKSESAHPNRAKRLKLRIVSRTSTTSIHHHTLLHLTTTRQSVDMPTRLTKTRKQYVHSPLLSSALSSPSARDNHRATHPPNSQSHKHEDIADSHLTAEATSQPATAASASTASTPVVAVWPVANTTIAPTSTSTTLVTLEKLACDTSTRRRISSGNRVLILTRYVQSHPDPHSSSCS
jgi:hypothetical protein